MSGPDEEQAASSELVVLRCEECGDTFPSGEAPGVCPSCGSRDVREAHEPLL